MQDTVFRQNVTTNFILWIVSVLLIKHDPTVKRFIYAGFFFIFGEVSTKLEIVLETYLIERRCKGIIFDKKKNLKQISDI